jgi:hypothetical protein
MQAQLSVQSLNPAGQAATGLVTALTQRTTAGHPMQPAPA